MSVARDDGAFHGVPSASIYQWSNFGSAARSFAQHVATFSSRRPDVVDARVRHFASTELDDFQDLKAAKAFNTAATTGLSPRSMALRLDSYSG
jgi:hypothetical protein